MFRQGLTSSTQTQIWSNHFVVKTRTAKKCTKMQNARAGRAELLFLLIKPIVLWRSRSRHRPPYLGSGSLIKQQQRRRQRERHLKIQLFRERLSKRSVRADLHGTIFIVCDDLRQAHDMFYNCCVSQKKYRSILKHVLTRCDNRKVMS